jgi:hypothetical protein
LKDQISENAEIRKDNPGNHPDRLDPAGNVMAPEQVGCDRNQQPKPHDETKYREGIQQEISKGEAFLDEEHCCPPSV